MMRPNPDDRVNAFDALRISLLGCLIGVAVASLLLYVGIEAYSTLRVALGWDQLPADESLTLIVLGPLVIVLPAFITGLITGLSLSLVTTTPLMILVGRRLVRRRRTVALLATLLGGPLGWSALSLVVHEPLDHISLPGAMAACYGVVVAFAQLRMLHSTLARRQRSDDTA